MPRPPSYLPPEEIEKEATDFLQEHHPSGELPIPIEEIIQQNLDFHIVPSMSLQESADIDAWTAIKRKEIYIDHENYMSDTRHCRIRFTLAHELGHIVLHQDYLNNLDFKSDIEWKNYMMENWRKNGNYEVQANIFAGYVLMPTHLVEAEFGKAKIKVNQILNERNEIKLTDELIAPYAARDIARVFEVSEESANYRLINWIKTQ